MKFNNHKTIAILVRLLTENNYAYGNSEEQSFYHRLQALKGEDLTLQPFCWLDKYLLLVAWDWALLLTGLFGDLQLHVFAAICAQ